MADLSSHPDFDLDTAISADLDDELDAYAAELGVPASELRAAVTDPAASGRRAELAAARSALGGSNATDDALDEVTRRRLLAGAGVGVAPARPARDRSFLLRAGAAAAVTIVLLAGIYAVTRNSGDSGAKSGASGGAAASASGAAPVTGDLGDLGAVDAARVGRLLRGDAAGKAASASSAPETSRDQTFTGNASSGAARSDSTTTVSPQAVDACVQQFASQGTIRFRGSGTYAGRPAVLIGLDTDRRTIVFVVAADNCTQVLYSAGR